MSVFGRVCGSAQGKPSGAQDPPLVQETIIKAVFDLTTIEDEPLPRYCIFKCIYIILGEAPLL